MMTTPRIMKAASAALISCCLLLAGCNTIEAGGQPLPSTTSPSAPTPSTSPTPTPSKSVNRQAAEKKVTEAYATIWKILRGKASSNDLYKVARNESGTMGYAQAQKQFVNSVLGRGWTLSGSRPVTIVGSTEAKKIKGRPQVLVDVCEDNTRWYARDESGHKVEVKGGSIGAYRLSVQKWPDNGKWYVARIDTRKGTCK